MSRPWAAVSLPVRFVNGDGAVILLGRRDGGRRYLSEDLEELSRLAAVVAEQVERLRRSEVQRLVSQAELRALQAQINPHFLFNSLNTLYGTIPRDAGEARSMVLNLAQIFRYFLQTDRTLIRLSEEIQIVRAYLEIEALRLGDRLKTEIEVDESAEQSLIPILSVQPLVENAVKHGIAARSGPGTVRVRAKTVTDGVLIQVSDDGGGFTSAGARASTAGSGVGLENVRQRLRLCLGDSALLNIESTDQGTLVSFVIPPKYVPPAVSHEVVV
jgi:LytS/YehU family sensor histidine kinase